MLVDSHSPTELLVVNTYSRPCMLVPTYYGSLIEPKIRKTFKICAKSPKTRMRLSKPETRDSNAGHLTRLLKAESFVQLT